MDLANPVSQSQFHFQDFLPGEGNRIPLAAAVHAAEHPGNPGCNPLFLWGAAGVGKTHLLKAIAQQTAAGCPEAKVIYVLGQSFAAGLIQAIVRKSTEAFLQQYREADVLLVDDVQFLTDAKTVQETFFQICSQLLEQRKQIVLTANRMPGEITSLDDRLKHRLAAGTVLRIQPPDGDTRREIVIRKAAELGLRLEPRSVACLAEALCNPKQIHHVLKELKARHDLFGMALTPANVTRILENFHRGTGEFVRHSL